MDKSKLKNLSREEKLKLISALEEKQLRKKRKNKAYTPNAGQLPVHKSSKPIRMVMSANGAGKSCMLVNEVHAAAAGYNPWQDEYTKVPAKVIVVLDSPSKVSDVFLSEYRKWHDTTELTFLKHGKPFISEMKYPNGSRVIFMFHQQTPEVFESIELSHLMADEPMPRHIFVALTRGMRTKNTEPKVLMVGTPIGASWIRKDLYNPWLAGERDDCEFFRVSTEVNKANLAKGYIEQFSRNLTEAEKRSRLHGEWAELEGLALAHLFSDERHVLSEGSSKMIRDLFKEEGWRCVAALDPHPSKKNHAVIMGVDKYDNMYVLDEMAEKATARQFAKSLLERWSDYNIRDWICDSLGSADMTGGEGFKSFIKVLNECGVRARATTFKDKSDEDFIERIKTSLELPEEEAVPPKIRLHQDCHGTIRDIKNVAWQKVRHQEIYKPKLSIGNKDYLACIKYALAAGMPTRANRGKIFRSLKTPGGFAGRKKGTR